MEALANMPFKTLNQLVSEIAQKFFQLCRAYGYKEEVCLLNNDIYLSKVKSAYTNLSDSEKNLINNEFFYQGYHRWWINIYSRATFYRYKKEAMLKFLEGFYHE